MACFATPCGLRYAGHCFKRAHAQQSGPALIPAGGKPGVTSEPISFLRNVELEMVVNGWAWVLDPYGPDARYYQALVSRHLS